MDPFKDLQNLIPEQVKEEDEEDFDEALGQEAATGDMVEADNYEDEDLLEEDFDGGEDEDYYLNDFSDESYDESGGDSGF